MVVPHPKGGGGVWTFVKVNFVGRKEDYKTIGLYGFDCKIFEKEEGGRV